MTTHILLIDDHALFRSGLSMVLAAGLKDVAIVEATSLEQALLLPHESFDLVLLDLELEGINGLEGIGLVKRRWPASRVLIVSASLNSGIQQEARRRGAQGFISKSEPPARMLELLDQVTCEVPASAAPQSVMEQHRNALLSPRQQEVLELLGLGLSNKLIGRRLNLSENTVRGHVQAILSSLKVSSRSEAAFMARRLGLID